MTEIKVFFQKLTDNSPLIGKLICGVTGQDYYHTGIIVGG